MNEFETYVKRYHTSHRKPYTYFGATKENFKGIGIELEFDSEVRALDSNKFRDDCAKLLAERDDADHFFIERDSSLQFGFEIVTQPHTVDEMKKFFIKFSEVFPQLMEFGATEAAKKAGLHVHVSRQCFGNTVDEQSERIAKIICFVANHPQDWIKSGRRNEVRKCAVREDLNNKEAALKYVVDTYGVKDLERRKIDRYVAINLRNKKTVEFRTMQSSFKLDVIFAELDFVMHLVDKSATIDWADISDARKWFENLPDNVVKYLKDVQAFVQYLD